ncbi:glycosyltransferase family 2 protein [Acinetobacter ursingii]|uniref:glycosyltransferase family 2 protein n=2 Tax=Acinetobacter ursingii TaxID=108980 RepID=UPI001250CA90|nr:glycosyltransferase family 2 protein [Acinetobacter ursingii]
MLVKAIVTFNPTLDNLETLIQDDQNTTVIVDNASNNQKFLSEKVSHYKNVVFLALTENKGIAFAQNVAIDYAIKNNVDYILFFDQDSHIDKNFISNLFLDFERISTNTKQVAAIGPRLIDEKQGFYFPALKFNNYGLIDKISVENISEPIEVSFLISSGTLVSVKALKEIGLMRDEFFIDFVDTEWCFRALSMGYKLYMSDKAFMKHSIGDDTLKFANFNIPVHSGFRRYYRIRNLFFMWKMPYIPKILVAKLMLTNFAIQVLLFLMKDKKMDYLKYYIKATKDGIKESKNYHV